MIKLLSLVNSCMQTKILKLMLKKVISNETVKMEMNLKQTRFSSFNYRKRSEKYRFKKRIHSNSCTCINLTMTKKKHFI